MAYCHELFPQTLARPADSRKHRSQRYSQYISRFLVRQLAHHYQQQRLTQFHWKSRERRLHFVREFVRGRVHCSNRYFQRTIANEYQSPASTPPTINHSPPQDRNQPCSLAAPTCKTLAALPRAAQSFLHDILGIVRITYQSVSNAVQRRGMIAYQDHKVRPGKRHQCLSLLAAPFR